MLMGSICDVFPHKSHRGGRLLVCIVSLLSLLDSSRVVVAQRIAIIGGGISGTFAAKYLVDYDTNCTLQHITIFDPYPLGTSVDTTTTPNDKDWQGSRVASLKMGDGRIVELGASVGHEAFHLVLEMMENSNLEVGPPFNTGSKEPEPGVPKGISIYDGNGIFAILLTSVTPLWNKLKILWRYNFELFTLQKASKMAATKFEDIHPLLYDDHDYFLESPDELWQAVGLYTVVHSSFDEVLDHLGLSKTLSWWRRYLPYQGCLREELSVAINQVNYNQDNSQVNGLVGLASFATSQGGLFSVVGGNYQLMQAAIQQAHSNRQQTCSSSSSISHVAKKVNTIVGDLKGLEVFAEGGELLGEYDAVILAAPLQQCRISFYVKSHMDDAVLQPMPLSGLFQHGTDDEDDEEDDEEDASSGDEATEEDGLFPRQLPEHATQPYTQVVTTLVSNVTFQTDYFQLPSEKESPRPRAVFMTRHGKEIEHNITAISQITADTNVYKVFSREPLDDQVLQNIFGPHYSLEYVKVWGGPHGGATPDYQGKGTSMDFLLYDGAIGLEGHTRSGALYYTNAIEGSMACIEISAMGAKSVAKLLAKRFGWLDTHKEQVQHDEL